MPAPQNVLVFPAGSEIGLEIERALRYIPHFRLIGATSVPDHSLYRFPELVTDLPFFSAPGFAQRLQEIIRDYDIHFIFPAHDDLVQLLPQMKEDGIIPAHVEIMTSCAATAALARSKAQTYAALNGKVTLPRLYTPATVQEADLPMFAKPDKGQGSKGAFKVATMADVARVTPDMVLCEFLPDDEFTVDCFTDRHGTLRYAKGRKRARIANGISVCSVAAHEAAFEAMAEAINATLSFQGMWFFQVKKRADGTPVLMEIAPRVAGAMGFARACGVNLPLLALYDRKGMDVDLFENEVEIVRD